ncbi:hypothetical protein FRC03_000963 [Tulasnella sp. 419]|nr:hypothetical protein FRC03_000963 [Tulasnella sp. 419]
MAENTESSSLSTSKLPLPTFLKVFTSGGISMGDAMALTKKIYPSHNSPSRLAELTPLKLTELKVDNKDQRKAILAAVRKAGYVKKESKPGASDGASTSGVQDAPVASSSSTSQRTKANLPRKRKKDDDLNEPLPDSTTPEGSEYGNFDFNEILDEKVLKSKSTFVNRAPVMTAWATVVAEAMGFNREEALSIASVYTEMNASSKGVSLGIFSETKHKDYVAGSSQPFVEFMGRTMYVFRGQRKN